MAEYYLMKRDEATMNVAPDKLAEYLADGWKVIKEPEISEPNPSPVAVETAAPAEPETLSVEDVVKVIGKKSRKG